MDPVVTLKRALEVDLKLCIFCQKHNKPKVDVREATSYSKNVVCKAMTKRRKYMYRDVANREVINCLDDLLGRNDDTCIVWKPYERSGLVEEWVKGGLLGPNVTEHDMNGKAYKRALYAHKITLQSWWQLLMPFLLQFSQKSYPISSKKSALACSPENVAALITSLKSPRVKKMLNEFVAQRSKENVNFKFWWNYMEMVSVLLMFTQAQREGIWDMYLHSFCHMLPYFFR